MDATFRLESRDHISLANRAFGQVFGQIVGGDLHDQIGNTAVKEVTSLPGLDDCPFGGHGLVDLGWCPNRLRSSN